MFVLSENIKKKTIKFVPIQLSFFSSEKNLCVLHGQVFVMELNKYAGNGGFTSA